MFCVTVVSGLWETGEAAQLQYHAAAQWGGCVVGLSIFCEDGSKPSSELMRGIEVNGLIDPTTKLCSNNYISSQRFVTWIR